MAEYGPEVHPCWMDFPPEMYVGVKHINGKPVSNPLPPEGYDYDKYDIRPKQNEEKCEQELELQIEPEEDEDFIEEDEDFIEEDEGFIEEELAELNLADCPEEQSGEENEAIISIRKHEECERDVSR